VICRKCGADKPETDFHRNSSRDNGLCIWCKECNCRSANGWGKQNPERRRESGRRWAEENRGRKRELNREWRKKYPERYREILHKHLETPKGKLARGEAQRRYCARYPGKKHAQKLALEIPLLGTCAMCGSNKRKTERHHPDYERPLLVIELCGHCHRQLHSFSGEQKLYSPVSLGSVAVTIVPGTRRLGVEKR
jgi:hypothetical protein